MLSVMFMLRDDQDAGRWPNATGIARRGIDLRDWAFVYGLFTLSAWANTLMASGLWLPW
jgi:hypothetical protein